MCGNYDYYGFYRNRSDFFGFPGNGLHGCHSHIPHLCYGSCEASWREVDRFRGLDGLPEAYQAACSGLRERIRADSDNAIEYLTAFSQEYFVTSNLWLLWKQ